MISAFAKRLRSIQLLTDFFFQQQVVLLNGAPPIVSVPRAIRILSYACSYHVHVAQVQIMHAMMTPLSNRKRTNYLIRCGNKCNGSSDDYDCRNFHSCTNHRSRGFHYLSPFFNVARCHIEYRSCIDMFQMWRRYQNRQIQLLCSWRCVVPEMWKSWSVKL